MKLLQWCYGKNSSNYRNLSSKTQQEINIAFIGRKECGQTSVIQQFAHGYFPLPPQTTVGGTIINKTVNFSKDKDQSNSEINLRLFDINTQLGLLTINSYINQSHDIFFLCYDLSLYESFNWIKDTFLTTPSYRQLLEDKKVVFLGCKNDKDIDSKFSETELKELSQSLPNSSCYTCSAKNNTNIQEVFQTVIQEFLNAQNENDIEVAVEDDVRCCC